MIIVIEFFIRLFIDCYIKEIPLFRDGFINKKRYIIAVFLGYIINYYFINRVSNVFLSGDEIKIIIWGGIIYICILCLRMILRNISLRVIIFIRIGEYVVMQYAKLRIVF